MMRIILLFCLALFVIVPFDIVQAQENRTIDGSYNNISHPTWGSTNVPFYRLTPYAYADGMNEPSGQERPNPRSISNCVVAQDDFIPNPGGVSDFGWGFGQFLDHDITFNIDTQSVEPLMNIEIPPCDPSFDPACTGQMAIHMKRAAAAPGTGDSPSNPREQENSITAWIDASPVYGSDDARSFWLRTFNNGKLKTSTGNLPPYNTIDGEKESSRDWNAPVMLLEGQDLSSEDTRFFICGDVRANEQPSLLSFHTLFLREHNRICSFLAAANPSWTDEQLYQRARKVVGALMQVVVYEEFLPTLGVELPPYEGYDSTLRGDIFGIFSAAAFRIGHTLVNDQLIRLDGSGDTLSFGSINIKDAFFNTEIVAAQGGIDPIFRGMATQRQQTFDNHVVNTLRNFLFGPPGSGGLDLVSLNIQRARERGFPDFNTIRASFGLAPYISFDQFSSNPQIVDSLATVYPNVGQIDPWVGIICEDIQPEQGIQIGETARTILAEQFHRLRDGDRFYYENDPAFSPQYRQILKNTRLSDIIMRNTEIENIQQNVFYATPFDEIPAVSVEMSPFAHVRTIDIQAFPNPVTENFTISINTYVPQQATLQVSDNVGRVVMEQILDIQRGPNAFTFKLPSGIASGLYVINLYAEDGKGQLKIVKN